MDKISYKDSGVNIDEGNSFVDLIKPLIKSTSNKNVIGGIGSFSGAYELPKGYENPVLFGATDGVGTKLKLAIESKVYDSIGIDLVAMCVNDLICNFAKPLFFLDYYATGKLDKNIGVEIIKGIVLGCQKAQCSLIGGESAEMPGLYEKDDFDLAGFAVGIGEKKNLQKFESIKEGDLVLAFASSGIHSNGYSLVRKVFFDKLKYNINSNLFNKPLFETLLTPTRIYVHEFIKFQNKIKSLAHITGGGITENLPRALKCDKNAIIYKSKIKKLEIFDFLSDFVEEEEMYRTFNQGVGLIAIVSKEDVDEIINESDAYIIGEIKNGNKQVIYQN